MSIHIKLNRTTAAVLDQKIVAAIDKYFAGAAKVTLAGEEYTPATLKAVFQRSLASADALDAARAALRQQVVVARARRKAMGDLRTALQRMLLGMHGEGAVQVLEDFGMSVPRRPGPKTVHAKADAVAKAEATRAQRRRRSHVILRSASDEGPPRAPGGSSAFGLGMTSLAAGSSNVPVDPNLSRWITLLCEPSGARRGPYSP